MPEPKQKLQLSVGHWITIGGFAIGILSTWFGITAHIKDDDIHLTELQRNNLIQFTTIVEEELPTIKTNEKRIIDIEKAFYGFSIRFDILYDEHESLEGKVSRNYVELINKIEE